MGNKKIYIIAMTAFLGWILFSNHMILSLSGFTPVKKVEFEQFVAQDPVYSSIIIGEMSNLSEGLSMNGWAFVETTAPVTQKYISAIFKSQNNCYEANFTAPDDYLSNVIITRFDVVNGFSDKNIQPGVIGFLGDFSSLPMKDGIYQLYLYCKENEENYGLADTGRTFCKDGSKFYEWYWKSEMVSGIEKTQDIPARSAISSAVARGAQTSIHGWSNVEGTDSSEQVLYLQLAQPNGKTETYTTLSKERPDVAKHFKNEAYLQSGFEAIVSLQDWEDGEINARIMVEINNEVYESASYTLLKEGEQIAIKK